MLQRPSHTTVCVSVCVSYVSINSVPWWASVFERLLRACVCTPVAINITLCSGFQPWESSSLIPGPAIFHVLEIYGTGRLEGRGCLPHPHCDPRVSGSSERWSNAKWCVLGADPSAAKSTPVTVRMGYYVSDVEGSLGMKRDAVILLRSHAGQEDKKKSLSLW